MAYNLSNCPSKSSVGTLTATAGECIQLPGSRGAVPPTLSIGGYVVKEGPSIFNGTCFIRAFLVKFCDGPATTSTNLVFRGRDMTSPGLCHDTVPICGFDSQGRAYFPAESFMLDCVLGTPCSR